MDGKVHIVWVFEENRMKARCTAVIMAAGTGTRMGTAVSKQYLELEGKPILVHTLETFQKSDLIADIVMVAGEDKVAYCRQEIAEKYGITKVSAVVPGGKERFQSVYCGLQACRGTDYVFIQDGVRPFVTEEILQRGYACAREHGSGICAVPSKDTVKIADESGKVLSTPLRKNVWSVQTPQVFRYSLIRSAYDKLFSAEGAGKQAGITDDAMVLETMTETPAFLFMGDYRNIKITTPEDLNVAEEFLRENMQNQ
jgi:2-C-methyl-D-erythritol 4-phosphate cytidylyltransferase